MAYILIVDDSISARFQMADILKENGYQVSEAVNGRDALKKMEINNYDCMILDLLMPDIDGFEVLETINETKHDIPVIVLSADIQETSKKKCLKLGVNDFLYKPMKKDELIKSVRKVVNGHEEN